MDVKLKNVFLYKDYNMKFEYQDIYESPIGIIEIKSNANAIISIQFAENIYKKEISQNDIIDIAKMQLNEYFSGTRKNFDLPIIENGTEYNLMVWKELRQIPYGQTVSYKKIAHQIGNPNSARAVGNANNKNPFVIFTPCHRIILSSGKLGGYGSGLWRKEFLLNLENKFC